MAYDIRSGKIEDPLNGIDDLKIGILKAPNTKFLFERDFFRIYSILKTSAKLSIKVSQDLEKFIHENTNVISV
jgi:hypothetical protein